MTSTRLQLITGGDSIPDDVIAACGGNRMFDGVVDGWHPPPEIPDQPDRGSGLQGLPAAVREGLALALAKAIEKATGFRVKVYLT